MDPALVTMIAILTFAGGIVIGYVTGWEHGSKQGYHVGWVEANAEIRRLLARARDV